MYEREKQYSAQIVAAVEARMFGLGEAIRLSLVALFTGGHVLLEGNPGLGKTALVKTLARVLALDFGRVQFTPDLMPADITGTLMPDPEEGRRLQFSPGPVFTQLLLADEINRATPKTQSAMLEAMAERQVTVLGTEHRLPEPFMVLATQNPIDHEGTFDLPEAQADRFMFKVLMPVPAEPTVRRILLKEAGAATTQDTVAEEVRPLFDSPQTAVQTIRHMRRVIEQLVPRPLVETHILNLVQASNQRYGDLAELGRKEVDRLREIVRRTFSWGLGPRTAIALMLGAKAWSLLFEPGVECAVPEALARVALPVLRHRVRHELGWDSDASEQGSDAALDTVLAELVIASAPARDDYRATISEVLGSVRASG